MKYYIGIGTIVKDCTGNIGKVIGYDNENKIVTIRYTNQGTTKVRNISEIENDIHVISYKEVE